MPASLQRHLWVWELGEEAVLLVEPLELLQEEENSLEYQVASQVQPTTNQYI